MSLFKNELKELKEEFETLQSNFDSVDLENAELRKENEELKDKVEGIAAITEEKDKLSADLDQANADKEELQKQLTESTEKQGDFDEKVAEKARQLMVAMGHDPIDETNEENTDVVSVFKGLKGKEAVEFYKKNRYKIHKALKGE